MNGVTVTLDKAAVMARIKGAAAEATPIITNEFIKDANYYARHDSGEMIRSSIRASKPDDGLAVWDTPYAKRVYYTGNPSHDRNKNASLMWAHKAARKFKAKYQSMAQKILDRRV